MLCIVYAGLWAQSASFAGIGLSNVGQIRRHLYDPARCIPGTDRILGVLLVGHYEKYVADATREPDKVIEGVAVVLDGRREMHITHDW